MENQAIDILKKVFGYDSFRPVQQQVIESVLDGADTMALMPTGGGKSLCYQIPGLVHPGICLVISPLIALMKDQVDQLTKRGVKAKAIYSGMHHREIDRVLDNCIYGDFKFLYVSPERLKSELFIERFRQMPVNLIAVDEAHCISQWGYDFRPPYLEIAAIRVHHPAVPIMALTASATPQVLEDIMKHLEMKKPRLFQQTFARENLSYHVRKVENKLEKGIAILNRIPGTAIWYVRNRQATQNIAKALASMGISATFYHAGLSVEGRSQRQEQWMNNHVRVMVSTNAFGMGIDKPDVRLVIHSDVPENIESYYQEAGRAGRDGQKSYAVLLCHEEDLEKLLERANLVYPPIDFVKRIYQCLANYFQLAVGSNMLSSFDFEWGEFAQTYKLDVLETFFALKVLEEEGFISLSESYYTPSRIHFLVNPKQLYEVQISQAKLDPLIKLLLRSYGGNLFSEYLKIQESKLAKSLDLSVKDLVKLLDRLAELHVVDYQKRKDKPQITFLTGRYDASKLPLNGRRIAQRRSLTLEKAKSMEMYARQNLICRTQFIQEYFGEKTDQDCGICDCCVEHRQDPKALRLKFRRYILETIAQKGALPQRELLEQVITPRQELVSLLLREMIDQGEVLTTPQETLSLPAHE